MKVKSSSCVVVIFVILALLAGTTGCQGAKKKSSTQLAEKRWSAARAAVLGSLAKGQLEAGQFDKGRQTLDEAIRLDPENANLRVLYGKLALEQGQLEIAERQLAEARRLDPKNAEADYLSGVVYQRWLKPQTAYDYYTAAAEKNRGEVAYPLAQAEMLVQLNRHGDAMTLLQSRLDDFGTTAAFHDTIGQLHLAQGDYGQAVESLRQASTLASDDAVVREHLAMALFYDKQFREAGDLFARILRDEKNKDRAELYIALGECQMNQGRYRDARENFEKATQLNASAASAWMSLTKAALQLNDVRRAEIALRKAMALAPNESESHLLLGYVRLKQNKLNEALEAFRKASSLDPADPISLCMIGYVLEKTGRAEQAVHYYGRALKVKPDDELAQRLMASVDLND